MAKAGGFVERYTEIATTTNLVIEDARPRLAQISHEALEITRLGREQVERIGDLLHDAGDKRARVWTRSITMWKLPSSRWSRQARR